MYIVMEAVGVDEMDQEECVSREEEQPGESPKTPTHLGYGHRKRGPQVRLRIFQRGGIKPIGLSILEAK